MTTEIKDNNNEFSAHFMVLSEKHTLHKLFTDCEELDKTRSYENLQHNLDDILVRWNIGRNTRKEIGSDLAYACQKKLNKSEPSVRPQPPSGPSLVAFVPDTHIGVEEFDFIMYRGPIGHIW